MKIAYQGEPGANSHIACRNVYPEMEPLPCVTFEDALAAVTEGQAELAMIAIENSIAGRVADMHYLLPTLGAAIEPHPNQFVGTQPPSTASGLYIVGEFFMPIHFDLLGVKGARLEDIKSVYSHVHALGQCRKIVHEHSFTTHIADDTAGAAREVAEWGDKGKAALASTAAAKIYGLDVLASQVEDEAHNTTRFIILSRTPERPEPNNGPCVTSFVFRVRNVPAALYKALGGFATNGVNMTKLESYMVEGEFTATQFLADVDGHPDEPALSRAFKELDFFCKEFKILGVYPAHQFRIDSEKRREFE